MAEKIDTVGIMKDCMGCKKQFIDRHRSHTRKLCDNCKEVRWRFYDKNKWAHSPSGRASRRLSHQRAKNRLKEQIYAHYGKRCVCCDETMLEFLTIDHVNGDGNIDRRNNLRGNSLYKKIINEGFSEDYQILCMNCNFGKKMTGTICPHQM